MNILEMESRVKTLPDDQLLQQAQNPTGGMPQYLLISEVARRKDMRMRADNARKPTSTVKDDVLGLAALENQQQRTPQQIQAPNAQQMQQVAGLGGYSRGGPIRYAEGGGTSDATLAELIAGLRAKNIPAYTDPYAGLEFKEPDFTKIEGIGSVKKVDDIKDNFNYAEAVEAARGRGASQLAASKKDALSQALLGIGTGIMASGTPQQFSKALNTAGQQAIGTLQTGRQQSNVEDRFAEQLGLEGQAAKQRVATMNSQIGMFNTGQQNQRQVDEAELKARGKKEMTDNAFARYGIEIDKVTARDRMKLENAVAGIDKEYKTGVLVAELEKIRLQSKDRRLSTVLGSLGTDVVLQLIDSELEALMLISQLDPDDKQAKGRLTKEAVNNVIRNLMNGTYDASSSGEGGGSGRLSPEEMLKKIREDRAAAEAGSAAAVVPDPAQVIAANTPNVNQGIGGNPGRQYRVPGTQTARTGDIMGQPGRQRFVPSGV